MLTSLITYALLLLLAGSSQAQDVEPPTWGNVTFENSTCLPSNPIENGNVEYQGPVYTQMQCGSIAKKRGFHGSLIQSMQLEIDSTQRKKGLFNSLLRSIKQKTINSRVVGGVEVSKNAWPWLAALGRKSVGPQCGAALINDQWVVTAAHCLYIDTEQYPCNFNIRLGEHNFLEHLDHQIDIEPEAIYAHPKYDTMDLPNDIALIKLKKPVDITTDEIRPVCLATSMDDYGPGTHCYIAGWGHLELGQNYSTPFVNQGEVVLIDYDKCRERYPEGFVEPGMMCAESLGAGDHCYGDSGGPLVCKNPCNNRWEAVGIITWGFDCGVEGAPGVYTSINYFREWIDAVLAVHA